ncbi:hypothetical protein OS493_026378 [Desmophyllum pertusum]|uniref:Uncharacterized protein n=1 Tax=Desmophyllum pertusum TaxID=174260 RepID=A0A9W9ZA99_9CNID|nr:hypothetical protein OS493_026378 [Desmophyllum pertusum]
MKQNNVEPNSPYLLKVDAGLLKQIVLVRRAYLLSENKRDVDSVKAVYNKMLDDGVQVDDRFLLHYTHIMMMSSDASPFAEPASTGSHVKAQLYKTTLTCPAVTMKEVIWKRLRKILKISVEELNDLK